MQLWKAADGSERAKYSDTTVGHRNLVIQNLADAWGGQVPLDEPLALSCQFVFARPASHFGTGRNAGVLKTSAPVFKASVPDVDKLLRLVGDALVIAQVVRDDALFVVVRGSKIWGERDLTRIALARPLA